MKFDIFRYNSIQLGYIIPRLPPDFIRGDFHPSKVFFPYNEVGIC